MKVIRFNHRQEKHKIRPGNQSELILTKNKTNDDTLASQLNLFGVRKVGKPACR